MTRILARLAALGALLVGLSGGMVGVATSAGAVTGIQTGYWQQHPGPAQVPDGGFEVASDPTGTQAVAAIRFTLDSGESDPILHVKLSQVLPDNSQFAITACPVAAKSSGWTPPTGAGAWADKPEPDCSGGTATGKLSDDGTTVTFDLSFLSFTDNTVDVLLQPDLVTSPVPSGVVDGVGGESQPTYDAAFDKVGADQVEVTSSPSSDSSSGSSPAGGFSGSTGSAPTGSSSGGASSSALGAALPSGAGVAAAPAPAAPVAPPVVASAPQAAAQQPVAAQAPYLVHHGRNWRLIIGIGMVASDLLLVMLFVGSRAEGGDARPTLSIYDLPPAPRPEPA